MLSRRFPRPAAALLGLVGCALAFGAWTGFPVLGDAIVPLIEHDSGASSLAARHADRPLYGWMLYATIAVIGDHRLGWISIGLALWGLLAWLTARLYGRLFPERTDWTWFPALLVLSPIVVQTQFESLTMVYPCVAPVVLAIGALIVGTATGEDGIGAKRSLVVFLLASLAALLSEYGIAAGCAAVVLLLALKERKTAIWLGTGTACGAIAFSLTADSAIRPDVTAASQLPKLLAAPLGAFYEWLSGIWYATIGAYGIEAGHPLLDTESHSTLAVAAAGTLGAVLAALAARRTSPADRGRLQPRRFAGPLLGVAVAILPVVAAGRPAVFEEPWVGDYDSRFLLPALPFASVLVAGALSAGFRRSMVPVAAALLAFLCVEASWRGALQAMRSQQWAEALGRVLLPTVRAGDGITVVVGSDDPKKRWGPILTAKMTQSWSAGEARRVWALPRSHAVLLIGDRETCRTPDAIDLRGESKWARLSGSVQSVVWIPDAGDPAGRLEPYCRNGPFP